MPVTTYGDGDKGRADGSPSLEDPAGHIEYGYTRPCKMMNEKKKKLGVYKNPTNQWKVKKSRWLKGRSYP